MPLLEDLVSDVGFSFGDALRIISTAPARYKVYSIRKRGGGERIIAQPSKDLKVIQRYILSNKLNKFPVHAAAAAYIGNRSIYENAEAHKESSVILKIDFENFFNSIKIQDWKRFAAANGKEHIAAEDIDVYGKILFWGQIKDSVRPRCLSVGAPTSPMISNILMFNFDQAMSEYSRDRNLTYTRYADDIVVSGNDQHKIEQVERYLRSYIRKIKSPYLKINEKKRGVYTRGGRRSVTGLIITPEGNISIGRDKKRLISSMVHHFVNGELTEESKAKLKGWLAFCVDNEVEFVERLRAKYGSEAITAALKYFIKPLLR